MKKILTIICCALLFCMIGCSENKKGNYDWFPRVKNSNEILLYDKFDQRFIAYNEIEHGITQKNTTQNYMQFEFNDLESNIYTAGHSVENGYKIVEKSESKIKLLYEMKRDEAIFPLAYKDENFLYFLKTSYNQNGKEIYDDRVICSFDLKNKRLNEINSTKGMLTSNAVIIHKELYFTVYNENNDSYDLYKLNIDNENKIQLIDENLNAGELYNNNDRLMISDNAKIYDYNNPEDFYLKKILNYFYKNFLFQIDIQKNGDLELTVMNIKTKEVERKYNKMIDVRVQDGCVYIYTNDEIFTIH